MTEVDWRRIDPLLGRRMDRELSKAFRVKPLLVAQRRAMLGIPAFKPSDAFWKPFDRLLGRVTDGVVAAKAGVTRAAVHLRRKKLGVCSYRERCHREGKTAHLRLARPMPQEPQRGDAERRADLPRDSGLIENWLGLLSDAVVAVRFCIPVERIRARRREMGLPEVR